MGVTFAAVGPMVAMADDPDLGIARHLRRGHRRRHLRDPDRAGHQPPAAAVPAGGDRHHHPDDRHLADAGRHQLGRRRLPPCRRRPTLRRPASTSAWPALSCWWSILLITALRQGLPRQHRGAARHRRRLRARRRPRHDELRRRWRRRPGSTLVYPFQFGMPKFDLGPDPHHVHRHDRGDDRIDRHVPGAGRDHRPHRSTRPP